MGRRGPDANGRYEHRLSNDLSVTLLHSRLSIIDLDPRANQPMRHGHHVIATNGEVYNYRELTGTLRGEGVTLASSSDTEVLLAAISRWGMETALDRAEGMWAFAAVDEAAGTVTLSRDRFGEKPLFLLEADGGLYFGSEVKFLFALSAQAPRANLDHLKRFLVNGYKALHKVSATFHEDVRELAAGTMLTISPADRKETRFWTPGFETDDSLSFEDSVAATREALIEAVGLRLRADVPLAFCLSGGVDSNAIISIARRVFDHDVHGFTIVNTDARYAEEELVRASVAELGLRHTSVRLTTTNFLENLDTLVRQHDVPVFTLSY
ncbi:MAG: asparagine synthase-related protein, partial [Alphaproteobacteria bacterium]